MSTRSASSRMLIRGVAAVAVVAVVLGGIFAYRWWDERTHGPMCQFRDAERSHEVSTEQAANAATIAMVANTRELPDRAVTIALATAIQESKLLNITYGDADSLGLFQQRPSQGWGSREEILNPTYASNAFYDELEQVDGWQDMALTVAAQTVQRSAFPDAYADHETEAAIMTTALTGAAPAAIGCRLDEPTGQGSAQRVADKAAAIFDGDAQVADLGLQISADTPEQAWAIAGWAVAHADVEDIRAVSVAGYRWDRSSEPLGWEIVSAADTDLDLTVFIDLP